MKGTIIKQGTKYCGVSFVGTDKLGMMKNIESTIKNVHQNNYTQDGWFSLIM